MILGEVAEPTNAPYGLVGGVTVERMVPNVGLEISKSGFAKFGWLKMLKKFAPTPKPTFSFSLNSFVICTSLFQNIGPRNWLRRWLPNVVRLVIPVPGVAFANSAPVKQGWFGLSHVPCGTPVTCAGITPVVKFVSASGALVSSTVNGMPLRAKNVCPRVQPPIAPRMMRLEKLTPGVHE